MQKAQAVKNMALAPISRAVKHLLHKMVMALVFFCGLLALLGGEASAAIINVGGACTLPNAVLSADFNIAVRGCSSGSSGTDTLVLQNGSVHVLTARQSGVYGGTGIVVTSPIIIEGNGSTIRRASSAISFRIFEVRAHASLTLKSLTISGGLAEGGEVTGGGGGVLNIGTLVTNDVTISGNESTSMGGGIFNAGLTVLLETTVSGNTSLYGGGIASTYSGASLVVQKSNISFNVGEIGGGILNAQALSIIDSNLTGNSATAGGGLYSSQISEDAIAAVATISRTTFSGNSAEKGGAIVIFDPSSRSKISNSTLSGNIASEYGGGILNFGGGYVLNSTIVNNRAPDGAGIYQSGPSAIKLGNTIVANSQLGSNCSVESGSSAIGGLGVNWISDASCYGVANSGNLNLGPLQDNGGPTFTHALLKGSAAIDSANPLVCAGSDVNSVDQRGKRRLSGAKCDIGAFEVSSPIMAPILYLLLDD